MRAEINIVDPQGGCIILMHKSFKKEMNNATISCLSITDTDSGCRPMQSDISSTNSPHDLKMFPNGMNVKKLKSLCCLLLVFQKYVLSCHILLPMC